MIETLNTLEDAKKWLEEEIEYIGIGFNPDTDFKDYIYLGRTEDNGKPVKLYADDIAEQNNQKMGKCFELFEDAEECIYEYCNEQL